MSRRALFQQLLALVAIIAILLVGGQAFGQGNRDAAFERVKEVQERHTEALLARPGVVGTAVGLGNDDNPAVVVLLEHGAVGGIPAALEGIQVKKIVAGQIVARANTTMRWPRPVPIGVSTGHPDITAGTIGCRVKTSSGQLRALSNNHVFANQNHASIDDNVLQPGAYDGGTDPDDAIGTLVAFQEIDFSGGDNTIDAALAATNGNVSAATPSDGYGAPSTTVVQPSVGLRVKKYGRTTILTTGRIEAVNATVNVGYDDGTARFIHQIIISPGSFSAGGDSGSLIVTRDGNNPVGLLFAGSIFYTIANPIQPVLDYFGVTIDDGSGPQPAPPVADFSGSPTSGVASLTVNFTDLSTNNPTSWSWTFGDGGSSTAQNPSHTYDGEGTYPVQLTAANAGGSDAESKTGYITVTAPPTAPAADFSASPTSGVAPLTVDFTDLSTGGPTSWSWTFGDGGSSTEQNPSYTYDAPGTYTVALLVESINGSNTMTKEDLITVNEPSASEPEPMTVAVSVSVTGRSAGKNAFLTATAVVTVTDSGGAPVAGASVSGLWSGNAYSGPAGGTTGANGTAAVVTPEIKTRTLPARFVFTVGRVTASGYQWDPPTPLPQGTDTWP